MKVLAIAVCLALTACTGTEDGVNGVPGESCTIAELEVSVEYPTGGSLITCGETSSVILNPEIPEDDPEEVVVLPCELEHKVRSKDRKCRFTLVRDEHGHRQINRRENEED